jgi:hypothetical protein
MNRLQRFYLPFDGRMSEYSDKPLIMLPGPTSASTEGLSHPERRADLRYPFTAAAQVFDILSQTRIAGRTSDIGFGGCYIDTLAPFAKGAMVRVRLELELQEFEAFAVVTYATAPMGMGLAFGEMKPECRAVLKTWVAKLSGERLPAPGGADAGPEGGVLAGMENIREVMKDLVYLMVRKKMISENEGAGIMRQLFR